MFIGKSNQISVGNIPKCCGEWFTRRSVRVNVTAEAAVMMLQVFSDQQVTERQMVMIDSQD